MSNLSRYAIVLALGLIGVGLQLAANSQTNTQTGTVKKAQTGSVSGRISIRGKGKAGIVVALRNADFRFEPLPLFKAITDPDGNYFINDVPAGSYLVAPTAPVLVFSDMTMSGQRGKPVIIAEGENVNGIDFALVRGGVITGKVLDAEGKPVIEERVKLIPVDSTSQRSPSYFVDFRTDDRGVYRMFGLLAGHYRIAVGEEGESGAFASVARGRLPYRQTFHPDVTDPTKATVVEVTEGGEASNIDITVGRTLQGFSVSGRVLEGESGQPVANIRIGLATIVNDRSYGDMPVRSVSTTRGEFKVEGLPPGKYSVFIAPQGDSDKFSEPVGFEVTDRDVTDLIIKTSSGASLTGVVALEGLNDKAIVTKLYQLRLNVWIQPATSREAIWRSAAIDSNGIFRLSGLPPGTANINTVSSQSTGVAKGFVVLRTEREGIRISQGIELKDREEISGLKVLVAYGTGVVRGVVDYQNGTTMPGSRIMAQLTLAGESVPLRWSEVDARGHFVIEGMPAGTYWLQISAYIPGVTNQRSIKQQVNVADATATEVTVKLDLDPKSIGTVP